eukprot:1113153-Pyramimonas_sp.AAC.1
MGKKSVVQTFEDALAAGSLKVFAPSDARNAFRKLLVDLPKLEDTLEASGGADAFGDWNAWGSVFSIIDDLNVSPEISEEELSRLMKYPRQSYQMPVAQQRIRQSVATKYERVNIKLLQAH